METTTIYRADNFTNNMGDFLGFFDSIEDAKSELEFSNEVITADNKFSQIAEFTVLTSELEKGEIEDKDFMMKIFGESKIIKYYYYK